MLYKKHLNLEDRKDLPLNGPSNYRVSENKVETRAIEINAVRQCNLSCKGCSHCSPTSNSKIYDSKILKDDLIGLSKFLKSEFIRVVGGEPLLHPNIHELLEVIKESNISDKTCLVTNGTLLNKLTIEDLKFIDKIEISLYPISKTLEEKILYIASKLSEYNTKIRILKYSDFRQPITQHATLNKELSKLTYETCQIAHNWRCITVDNGMLYRCPQSMIYSENQDDYSDAIIISSLRTYDELLRFLENNNYLFSCKNCLGSIGKKFKHKQINRIDWVSNLPLTPEEGIDIEYAKELEKSLVYESDCMKRNKLN